MMQMSRADFTLTFRRLCDVAAGEAAEPLRAMFIDLAAIDAWLGQWQGRAEGDPAARAAAMRGANPAYIPRNHRVEHALQRAVNHDDMTAFDELFAVLQSPYTDQPQYARYADPPAADFGPYRTFCGT